MTTQQRTLGQIYHLKTINLPIIQKKTVGSEEYLSNPPYKKFLQYHLPVFSSLSNRDPTKML
jgi:hypothetical protein